MEDLKRPVEKTVSGRQKVCIMAFNHPVCHIPGRIFSFYSAIALTLAGHYHFV